jgi:hypothetical protein
MQERPEATTRHTPPGRHLAVAWQTAARPWCAGLLVTVADPAGQGERSGVAAACLLEVPGGQQGPSQAVERLRF